MGLFDIIGQTINAASNAYQTQVNARVARENTDKTIAANKGLAEYQYSKDLEMWNRQNEYNSPSAQMQRFSAAGLNPNLMYGQGNAGNASQMPRYQAPTVKYDYQPAIDLPQMMSSYMDFALRSAQIDVTKERADNVRQANIMLGLKNLDQQAKNYFNFGNANLKDIGVSPSDVDELTGYGFEKAAKGFRSDMAKYQAVVLSNTMNDLVNKVRLSNANTQSQINARNISASGQKTKNILLAKDVNWYNAKAIADMATKAAGAIGVAKLPGMLKKPNNYTRSYNPVYNKYYQFASPKYKK